MTSVTDFIDQYDGHGIDYDGVYGDQCMDLAHIWANNLGVGLPAGNAVDMIGRDIPGATWVPNSATNAPLPGDLPVWHANVSGVTGQYGHIAAPIISADPMSFVSFDQNWPTGTVCHKQSHSYKGLAGWIHPNNYTANVQTLVTPVLVHSCSVGARVRSDATTGSPDNQGTGNLRGGVAFNITAWVHGEAVSGNDVWYRTIHNNWVWSGATIEGLSPIGGQGGGEASANTSEAVAIITIQPPTPEYETSFTAKVEQLPILRTDAFAIDVTTGAKLADISKGELVNIGGYFTYQGKTYARTVWATDNNKWNGIDEQFFLPVTGQPSGTPKVTVNPNLGKELVQDFQEIVTRVSTGHNLFSFVIGPLLRLIGKKGL